MTPRTIQQLTVGILVFGFVVGGIRAWRTLSVRSDEVAANSGYIEVPLLTTKDKDIWIKHQILNFNVSHPKVQVIAQYVESRDAMSAILYAQKKPVLWCPDSPVWVARANDVWKQSHHVELIDLNDPSAFRVLMQTPLVFLTTRKKAEFLRPLLEGDHAWSGIQSVSTERRRVPWGKLRFAYSNPVSSNIGLLALALMLHEYAQTHGRLEPDVRLTHDAGFLKFLHEIDQASVPTDDDPYTLTQNFVESPDRYDFIVTQESLAIDAALHHSDLVAIYPNPTTLAQETVCSLQGNWISDQQKQVAREFLDYFNGTHASKDALVYHMRLVNESNPNDFNQKLNTLQSQGFQQTYSSVTLPSYDTLNELIVQWNRGRKE